MSTSVAQLPGGQVGRQFIILQREVPGQPSCIAVECQYCSKVYTVDTDAQDPWASVKKHAYIPSKTCQQAKQRQQQQAGARSREADRSIERANTPPQGEHASQLPQSQADLSVDISGLMGTPSEVHLSARLQEDVVPSQLYEHFASMEADSVQMQGGRDLGTEASTPQAGTSSAVQHLHAGEPQVAPCTEGDYRTTVEGNEVTIFTAEEVKRQCDRYYQLESEQFREVSLLNGRTVPEGEGEVPRQSSTAPSDADEQQELKAPNGAPARPGSESTIYRFHQGADKKVHNKVKEYSKVLDWPVDPIHRPGGITVADAINMLQEWRQSHPSIPKQAVDELCAIIKYGILRDNAQQSVAAQAEDSNYFPGSQRVMDDIIGLQQRDEVEWHYCPCGKFAWPPYLGDTADLKDVKCFCCKRQRVLLDTKTQKYYAPQPFWYFGLERAIRDHFMTNPDWAPFRATDEARQNTFYTSEWSQWLREQPSITPEVLDDRRNSVYALGFDWFQPFKWKSHSVGTVVLRSLDVADKYLSISSNSFPLMFISGPQEPPCMLPFLSIIGADFNRYGPSSGGMSVTPAVPWSSQQSGATESVASGVSGRATHTTTSGGTRSSRHSTPNDPVRQLSSTFQHRAILGLIEADKPAQAKVSAISGHIGYLSCHWCAINSTACPGWGGKRYIKGYDRPTLLDVQKIKQLSRDPPEYKAGEQEITLTAEEIAMRGKQYVQHLEKHRQDCEEAKRTNTPAPKLGPNPFGATGPCGLQVIPYFNMRDHFAIGTSHCAVRGVGNQLLRYLFDPKRRRRPQQPTTTISRAKAKATAQGTDAATEGQQAPAEPVQLPQQDGLLRTRKRKRKGGKGKQGKRLAKGRLARVRGATAVDTDEDISDVEAVADPQGGPRADDGGNLFSPEAEGPSGAALGDTRLDLGESSAVQRLNAQDTDQHKETPGSVASKLEWQQWCTANPDWQSRIWFAGPLIRQADNALMRRRGVNLVLSCDQSRPYKCVVQCKGNFQTIDAMLMFHSPVSSLIMRGIILCRSQEFTLVFHALNRAIAFFARPYIPVQPAPDQPALTVQDVKRMYEQLLSRHEDSVKKWARFAQANGLPDPLLTSNLHTLFCRLATQCRTLGHCGAFLEMYIERVILAAKAGIRGKVNAWPEKVVVNQQQLTTDRKKFAITHRAKSVAQILERGQYKELYGRISQTGQTDDAPEQEYFTAAGSAAGAAYTWDGQHFDHRLEGQGKELQLARKFSNDSVKIVLQIVNNYVSSMAQRRILPQQVADAFAQTAFARRNRSVVLFHGLLWRQAVRMLAYSHPTERFRESYWVLLNVRVARTGRAVVNKLLVGKVMCYLYCKLPAHPNVSSLPNYNTLPGRGVPPPLRLALVTVFDTQQVDDFGNELFKVDTTQEVQLAGTQSMENQVVEFQKRASRGVYEDVCVQAVSADDIVSKVIYTLDDDTPHVMWCVKSAPVTGRLFDEALDLLDENDEHGSRGADVTSAVN